MLNTNLINPTSSNVITLLASKGTRQSQVFQKDMSLTMADFVRTLPKSVEGVITETDSSILSFRIENDEGIVSIVCHPMANRQLGSLSLPRLKVEIEICDYNEAQTELFFNRFNLAFLRMGG